MTAERVDSPLHSPDSYRHPDANAEWWFFQVQNQTGLELALIYYANMGVYPPSVSLQLNVPGEKPLSIHKPVPHAISNPEVYLDFGEHNAQRDENGAVDLTFASEEATIHFAFNPHILGHNVPIADPRMGWRIEIPHADVTGEITYNGSVVPVQASGYHDHNWFTGYNFTKDHIPREVLSTVLAGWQFGKLFGERNRLVYGFHGEERYVLAYQDTTRIDTNGIQIGVTSTGNSSRFGIEYPNGHSFSSSQIQAEYTTRAIVAEKSLAKDETQHTGYIRGLSNGVLEINGVKENTEGVHETWF